MSIHFRRVPCLAIDIHRCCDAGVTHKGLLNRKRCPYLIQPTSVGMAKAMPADRFVDANGFSRAAKVAFLNFLLMVRSACFGVGEHPFVRCRFGCCLMLAHGIDQS